MPVPATVHKDKRPQEPVERTNATPPAKEGNVRPQIAVLVKKVIKENAPTWQELAKR